MQVIWCISINEANWPEIERHLSCLPVSEQHDVTRYRRDLDRCRAFISRCMQRIICSAFKRVNKLSNVDIIRSTHGKPTLSNPIEDGLACHFNVTHHGDWVMMIVELISCQIPLHIGCDITTVELPRITLPLDHHENNEKCNEFIANFTSVLTSSEIELINHQQNNTSRLRIFYSIWSLKEAVVKAIGLGLSFDLRSINCSNEQLIWLDQRSEWSHWKWNVQHIDVDSHHIAAIARAHQSHIQEQDHENDDINRPDLAWMWSIGESHQSSTTTSMRRLTLRDLLSRCT